MEITALGETKSRLPIGPGAASQEAIPRRGPVKLSSIWLAKLTRNILVLPNQVVHIQRIRCVRRSHRFVGPLLECGLGPHAYLLPQ